MIEKCDVSVVIPFYKAELTIERAVSSVASQTLLPREIIIVDDNGDDSDSTVLDDLGSRFPELAIRVLKNARNSGAAYSRNRGWDVAVGKYVAFLDADDSWHPSKLRVQYDIVEKNDAVIAGHRVGNGGRAFASIVARVRPIRFASLVFRNFLPTPTVMVLRSLTTRFRPSHRYVDDHLLWLEISSQFPGRGLFIDAKLAFVYKRMYGDSGLSSNLLRMELGEIKCYRVLRNERHIGNLVLLFLVSYSLLKFFRRVTIVTLRRVNQL